MLQVKSVTKSANVQFMELTYGTMFINDVDENEMIMATHNGMVKREKTGKTLAEKLWNAFFFSE